MSHSSNRTPAGPTTSFGPFEFDAGSGLLYRGEQETLLPFRVSKVLGALLECPGEVLTKDQLLAEAWQDTHVGEDSLTQAISMIRSALGDDPRDPVYIQTIPKRGYRFIAEVQGGSPVSGVPHSAESGPPSTDPDEQSVSPARRTRPVPLVSPGTSLGQYEILSELGAGAMGVVYRARDTVLERDVAIKVLPEDFVSDPERVTRFEQEAKLLAAVSHPNIAGIHSLEEEDGAKFPVMELVEGETLEERLRSGRVGVEEAIELARQIASALEAAHERNIVHRDLKPANIKVAPGGQVKVLDFGLAKALEVKVFEGSAAESPTASMTIMGSRRGSIVGTAAYMSPEQARGQEADKRADIWSFGCVFYEMLTGQRAFGGDTVSDTIAGLLEREPDWEALPADTPPAACRVLRRCLSKDSDRRLHAIADARIELEEAGQAQASGDPVLIAQGPPRAPLWKRGGVRWAAVGLAIGAVATLMIMQGSRDRASPPAGAEQTTWFRQGIPPETSIRPRNPALQLAVSPDGGRIVFRARREGVWRLYQSRLNQLEATSISGTEGANNPFFSPGGESLGFFADGKLKKIDLASGRSQELCDVPNFSYGAAWGPDGQIVYNPGTLEGLWSVPETGGSPSLVLAADPRSGVYSYEKPSFLPGGKSVLLAVYKGGHGTWALGVLDLETRETRVLIEGASYGVFLPTGHIMFGKIDGLHVVGFDIETMSITGTEVPVIRDVGFRVFERVAQFAVSPTGTLAYIPGIGIPKRELLRVSLDGEPTLIPAEPRNYVYPRFSPKGDLIAVNVVEARTEVLIVNAETGISSPLVSEGSAEWPMWNPDGRHVTYSSLNPESGSWGVYQKPFGGGPEDVLFETVYGEGGELTANQWSPDGRALVGQGNADWREGQEQDLGIAYLSLDEPGGLKTLVPPLPGGHMHGAAFSPGGDWVAYVSNHTGTHQVFVTPFPGGGESLPISSGEGDAYSPLWSPDGRRIYYYSWSDERMMVVDVVTEPTFSASAPRALFEYIGRPIAFFYSHPNYDLHPDGRSFVVVRNAEEPPLPTYLNVATNWFAELEEMLQTGH
jgi:serine/threonine-protein kinase